MRGTKRNVNSTYLLHYFPYIALEIPKPKLRSAIDILSKQHVVKMADEDSEFSWGYFENTNDSFDVPEIGSDISVSPVSSPDLSLVNLSSESDSEDEDLAWRPNLRKPNIKPFTEAVCANFQLGPLKNELDFFLKFFAEELLEISRIK